ncbi:PTS lactose/cellobiose transporter subunit IIA [Pectinatus brassicae]|uniref:PTS system cellobiose-specific IIA component n=1 Tax=Pectinatus brassicae TaxID=862415 RepID=A0A840UDS5_9FIRM|nr:PTS lactose/cellobiose transporter subunit IIA [Pectinatus brassicae]MBB5335169.1 PTS system cellobiose-specific IIA component [Pectinatus brassicae]
MTRQKNNENVCLDIVKEANTAKNGYLQAIQLAKQGEFENAVKEVKTADEYFDKAHAIHTELLQAEADKGKTEVDLLLVHAEDIMMNAESSKVFTMEIIALYLKLSKM